jgi:carbonic anhydrase/acetyltransferase-like protein (isoleucine patch superfamily)
MSDVTSRLEKFLRQKPRLGQGVYIAQGAVVFGDVTLGDYSSVWYNAVLRGDIERIVVGHHTNIQDNAVVHLADDMPCILGDYVTVGHSAVVHACTVGNECLIGIGATVLDGAVIGDQCLIAAGSVVPPGKKIAPGSMVVGVPGKVVRELSMEERAGLRVWADKYVANAEYCLRNQIHLGKPL